MSGSNSVNILPLSFKQINQTQKTWWVRLYSFDLFRRTSRRYERTRSEWFSWLSREKRRTIESWRKDPSSLLGIRTGKWSSCLWWSAGSWSTGSRWNANSSRTLHQPLRRGPTWIQRSRCAHSGKFLLCYFGMIFSSRWWVHHLGIPPELVWFTSPSKMWRGVSFFELHTKQAQEVLRQQKIVVIGAEWITLIVNCSFLSCQICKTKNN